MSVGLALVTDVCVLCLDEPTSGLDSYTATEVRIHSRGILGASSKFQGMDLVAAIEAVMHIF